MNYDPEQSVIHACELALIMQLIPI